MNIIHRWAVFGKPYRCPTSIFVACFLFIAAVSLPNLALAQFGDGGGDPVIEVPVQVPDSVNGGTQDRQSGSVSAGDGQVEPQALDLGGDREDLRNQGFVGATADRAQALGFVGAASESSGPPLTEGATFGGGVNGGSGGGSGGGGFGGQGGGFGQGGFGQGGFGTNTQNGVQIVRQNLRTRVVPKFSSPNVSSSQVASRFSSRIARQPAMGPMTGGVQIFIENKTATLTGVVGSPEQRDQLERQLRLEPGVYRIVNQIQVER